jgi:hypothetical protein
MYLIVLLLRLTYFIVLPGVLCLNMSCRYVNNSKVLCCTCGAFVLKYKWKTLKPMKIKYL